MRYTMDIHFGVEAEKDAFVRRLAVLGLSLVAMAAWLALTTSVLCQPCLTLCEGVVGPISRGGKRAPNYPVLHEE